jgi:Tol biopolymer transport system component
MTTMRLRHSRAPALLGATLLAAACSDSAACDTHNPLMPVCPVAAPALADESVVFNSNRDGDLEVYVMNADGTRQVRLTHNPGEDVAPSWSPDRRQILFASVRGGLARQLYVMNADGSDVRQLTNQPGTPGFADWSPDGQRIAFHAARGDTNWDIWVINADGTDPRRVLTTGSGQRPRWSPDGQRLLFSWHQHNGGSLSWTQIAVINADGTGLTPLSVPHLHATGGAWSPDGRHIAFSVMVAANDNLHGMLQLAIMNADGTGVRVLGTNTMSATDVAWSRTSGRIYFSSDLSGFREIYSILPDGTDLRRLTGLPYSSDLLPRVW